MIYYIIYFILVICIYFSYVILKIKAIIFVFYFMLYFNSDFIKVSLYQPSIFLRTRLQIGNAKFGSITFDYFINDGDIIFNSIINFQYSYKRTYMVYNKCICSTYKQVYNAKSVQNLFMQTSFHNHSATNGSRKEENLN